MTYDTQRIGKSRFLDNLYGWIQKDEIILRWVQLDLALQDHSWNENHSDHWVGVPDILTIGRISAGGYDDNISHSS